MVESTRVRTRAVRVWTRLVAMPFVDRHNLCMRCIAWTSRFALFFSLAPWTASAVEPPATLPGTEALTWDDNLADRMMDGLHRFAERKIAESAAGRSRFWKR